MLIAVAAITREGNAGLLFYLFGHGLAKGALFMIAGILLSLRDSEDEIALYGRARDLWPAGIVMAIAGLLLGDLPAGLLHHGSDLIETASPGVKGAVMLGSALTGAAVLRAAARIFAGVSGAPGVERTAPTQREREKGPRPLPLMLAPCVALLILCLTPARLISPFLDIAAARLVDPTAHEAALIHADTSAVSYLPIALAVALAALSIVRRRATSTVARLLFRTEKLPFDGLQILHSGLVADYVAWMMIGVALLAVTIAWL
jgi:multicomponent Na+:H+ antiporter subunit D